MNDFWNLNGTKILGAITAMLGTLSSLLSMGAFAELLTKTAIGWLSIFVALATAAVGGTTIARGFNNTVQVRVAEAMQTAIKASPAQQGFIRPLLLALLLAVSIPTSMMLSGCPSMGLTQPKSFEDKLGYAYTQNTGIRSVSTRALDARLIGSDDAEHVLAFNDRARNVLDLAKSAAQAGDMQTAEGRLLMASSILTDLENFLASKGAK